MEEIELSPGESRTVQAHHRLKNVILINSGPAVVTVKRGDGADWPDIWVGADETIMVYDRLGTGIRLTATDDRASVIVQPVFSRVLQARE